MASWLVRSSLDLACSAGEIFSCERSHHKSSRHLEFFRKWKTGERKNRRPVSSVGRALGCCAGDRWFKPRPDQHSGSLNN